MRSTYTGVCLLAVVFMGWLAACPVFGQASSEPQKKNSALTLATYNINYGNPDLSRVTQTIRESKADVVLLQETNRKSRLYFQRRLKNTYPYMKYRDGKLAEGFAFLSKTPIKKTRFVPRKHGYFGTWIATIDVEGKAVQIVNVHLQPMIFRPNVQAKDLPSHLRKTEGIRLKELALISKYLEKDAPVIVAGDFNAPPAFPSACFLIAKGFVDSFASVTKDAAKHHTWRWKLKSVEVRNRFDYIFHSSHFETQSSEIMVKKGSDHFLVKSSMVWAEEKEAKAPGSANPDSSQDSRESDTNEKPEEQVEA